MCKLRKAVPPDAPGAVENERRRARRSLLEGEHEAFNGHLRPFILQTHFGRVVYAG
ncbi:MAG: hypothetical protein H0W76_00940 [Pyrinomonadaceae bacterium]|nr:hypothetical protein [Pyrinomonadaceae bacterium]